jgi:AraC family transcriptional regulator of adaptative response/methylated-DNA-[protein]-cysteine methyltransferase
MGASPLAYQRGLRLARLRNVLKQGGTVTNAIYEAGFSSQSRAYEVAALGMTPARFAKGGAGEKIGFGCAHTKFGWIVAGATPRGLCWLALAATKTEAEATLRAEFPLAALERDAAVGRWIERALENIGSSRAAAPKKAAQSTKKETAELLDLRGTAFQLRVWQALRKIPRGQTLSYSELARELGNPNATRAVARACACNRVSLLVPCHRVVGASGALTGYRWGVARKQKILEAEGANAKSKQNGR